MRRALDSLAVWLALAVRHWLRVGVVAFFLVCFVAFTTANGSGWLGVALGALAGLFFGIVFAFGD